MSHEIEDHDRSSMPESWNTPVALVMPSSIPVRFNVGMIRSGTSSGSLPLEQGGRDRRSRACIGDDAEEEDGDAEGGPCSLDQDTEVELLNEAHDVWTCLRAFNVVLHRATQGW